MIFIDANVFLSYDNCDDVHHARALDVWAKIASGTFGECFTSDYVLNEVVGVTLRKRDKRRAVTLGRQILHSILVVNVDDHILKRAWRLFTSTKLNLSLVDCTNIVVMEMVSSASIATFDKAFHKAGVPVVS